MAEILNGLPSNPAPRSSGAMAHWSSVTENDTFEELATFNGEGLGANIQATGTFGGATLVLQGSNDGTNFVTLKDLQGNDISLTAAGLVEFSTACKYVRPSASGGSSQSLNVHISLRG